MANRVVITICGEEYTVGPAGFRALCARKPAGRNGSKKSFFPLPLLSELVKVLIIFDFNGAGNPSWVSRAHPLPARGMQHP